MNEAHKFLPHMVSGVGLDLLKIRRRVRVYFDPPKMSHSFAIRPIIASNGNPTGKLLVRSTGIPAGRVGSCRVFDTGRVRVGVSIIGYGVRVG